MSDPTEPTSRPADESPPGESVPKVAPSRQHGGVAPSLLSRLDDAMAGHVWHPRVIPFLTYLILLTLTGTIADYVPATYPLFYTLQILVVSWMLWRYRDLLPELTLSFHWLAIPTGIIVFIAWVWLGMVVDEMQQVKDVGLGSFTSSLTQWFIDPSATSTAQGGAATSLHFVDEVARSDSIFIRMGLRDGSVLAWIAFIMRLIGMSIVVPLFEELFIRSLLLRSFNSAKNTFTGIVQVAQDFPVIGEKLMGTKLAEEADKQPPMFEHEFKRVPLGTLSMFGIAASTLIFTLSHVPRDYAACIFCGIAYCLCLRFTRHKGLGPVCWAHGITNALIWIYTLHTDDWRFL